jgi:hypothetical protein
MILITTPSTHTSYLCTSINLPGPSGQTQAPLRLGVGLGSARAGAHVLVVLWLVQALVRAQNMLYRR